MLGRDEESTEILFHHRFPTSTANVRNACHPFSTKDTFESQYILVHNGVVRNPDALKREHESLGIEYVSQQENGKFNDSEALLYDVARYIEGDVERLSATGTIAFIVVKKDKSGKPMQLFFGRNYGNPLKMKRTEYSITISSEGEGEEVEAHKLYCLHYDTNDMTVRKMDIPGSYARQPAYKAPTKTTYTAPKHSSPTTTHTTTNTSHGSSAKPGQTQKSEEEIRKNIEHLLDEDSNHTDLPGWEDGWGSSDDLANIEKRWEQQEAVKDAKDEFLKENNYDLTNALLAAEAMLRKLKSEQTRIDVLSEDEDTEMTSDLVQEWCENEEAIRILEQVVKSLAIDKSGAPIKTGEKEEKGNTQMGFHIPATDTPKGTSVKTGVVHTVPTKKPEDTKQLPPGKTYAD